MAWEALNTIAADTSTPPRRLVIIVNDNGRSYAPTVGGFAAHLDELRTTSGYEKLLSWGKETLRQSGAPGRAAYSAIHGVKRGLKDMVSPPRRECSTNSASSTWAPSTATTCRKSKRRCSGPSSTTADPSSST
jgi:deoxyxylulose-5-phosphate synthase